MLSQWTCYAVSGLAFAQEIDADFSTLMAENGLGAAFAPSGDGSSSYCLMVLSEGMDPCGGPTII